MKSKIIAISAISAGLIGIALTVGASIELADMFALVIASVFVMLPLYYQSYKGSVLCFLAGGIIALLFSGFNILSLVFPSYFIFFGIYQIISILMREKKVKKPIYILIGLCWCIAFFIGAYFYYFYVMQVPIGQYPAWAEFIVNNLLLFIIIFSVIFYFFYDRYIFVFKKVIDRYLSRIIKKDK